MLAGAAVFMTPTSSTAAAAIGSAVRAPADRVVTGAGDSPGGRPGAQLSGGTTLWRAGGGPRVGGGGVGAPGRPGRAPRGVPRPAGRRPRGPPGRPGRAPAGAPARARAGG